MSDQPPARRRRVAPQISDPMAPTVPVTPAPTVTETTPLAAGAPLSASPTQVASATPGQTSDPSAAPQMTETRQQLAAVQPASLGRRAPLRSAPTVTVFVRTDVDSKDQFEVLAAEQGLTQRAMFEQLVADAWKRRARR